MSTSRKMFRRLAVLSIICAFLCNCGGGMSQLTSGYVELSRATRPTIKREYTNPLEVRYNNNGAEVNMNFDLADSELDLNFEGSVREIIKTDNDYSYSDVTKILTYYKIIQENIGSGNYEIAEFHNNEMVKLTKLPEFYNIRGTLFYLKQDTANAQKYWDLATTITDSINSID